MNPSLMSKGICPDNGLIGLNYNSGDHRDQPASREYFIGIDICYQIHEALASMKTHHYLFQRGIPSPLPYSVYGYFGLSCPGLDTGQGIGRGQA